MTDEREAREMGEPKLGGNPDDRPPQDTTEQEEVA